MPYVITKINGKKFGPGHQGSNSAVFTKTEVERVAADDCVTAVNLVTRRTEKFGCGKKARSKLKGLGVCRPCKARKRKR